MKKVRIALVVLVVLLVGIQVVRPDRTNPPEDPKMTLEAVLSPPAAVDAVLARACADCHSSRTKWPWYTQVAPVSWWVAQHVHEGRQEVSFSEWGKYSLRRQAHKLEEMCEQMQKGEMPLGSYVKGHPEAEVSSDDVKLVCDWATREHERLAALAPPPAAAPPK